MYELEQCNHPSGNPIALRTAKTGVLTILSAIGLLWFTFPLRCFNPLAPSGDFASNYAHPDQLGLFLHYLLSQITSSHKTLSSMVLSVVHSPKGI